MTKLGELKPARNAADAAHEAALDAYVAAYVAELKKTKEQTND